MQRHEECSEVGDLWHGPATGMLNQDEESPQWRPVEADYNFTKNLVA